MLEHQKEHFVRDFLRFSHFVASESTFSYESCEPQICYLKIDVSCEASVSFHHISQNATPATEFTPCHLSPLDAALTMRLAKKTRNTTRLKCCACHANPRKMTMDTSKVLHLPRKLQRIFWKRRKTIAPATQNDFRHVTETRLTVTKCHVCHAKRSNATCETSKSDPFCTTYHGHGHTALTRTVADGCATSSEHTLNPQTPRPPEWNGNPCYAFGKNQYKPLIYYSWNAHPSP